MKAMLASAQKSLEAFEKLSQNYNQNVSKLVEHENVLIMLYSTVLFFFFTLHRHTHRTKAEGEKAIDFHGGNFAMNI